MDNFSTPDENKRLQRLMNTETLKTLADEGCSLDESLVMFNVFYVSTAEIIEGLRERLEGHGFAIHTIEAAAEEDRDSSICLTAGIGLVPDAQNVDWMTDTCVELADELGAVYDGWYVEV